MSYIKGKLPHKVYNETIFNKILIINIKIHDIKIIKQRNKNYEQMFCIFLINWFKMNILTYIIPLDFSKAQKTTITENNTYIMLTDRTR